MIVDRYTYDQVDIFSIPFGIKKLAQIAVVSFL